MNITTIIASVFFPLLWALNFLSIAFVTFALLKCKLKFAEIAIVITSFIFTLLLQTLFYLLGSCLGIDLSQILISLIITMAIAVFVTIISSRNSALKELDQLLSGLSLKSEWESISDTQWRKLQVFSSRRFWIVPQTLDIEVSNLWNAIHLTCGVFYLKFWPISFLNGIAIVKVVPFSNLLFTLIVPLKYFSKICFVADSPIPHPFSCFVV